MVKKHTIWGTLYGEHARSPLGKILLGMRAQKKLRHGKVCFR